MMKRFALLLLALTAACASKPAHESPTVEQPPEKAPATALLPIELVAEISETRPGNLTVTPAGRIIITQHPLDQPALRVVELLPDGTTVPFPNAEWAGAPKDGKGIESIIGIASDSKGVVWLLDMGSAKNPAQLVAWDSVKNELHKRIEISRAVMTRISFLQDFAIDEKRGAIYIADMSFPAPQQRSRPAFVVVDIASGKARRVLDSAAPLMPSDRDVVIDGSLVGTRLPDGSSFALHLGLNPIAIDPAFEWVYFATINGKDVFRVPAAELHSAAEGSTELLSKIERYSNKPPCDGIAVDDKGRVFITDIVASGVGVSTPDGYRLIAQDKTRLSWPDGFALSNKGELYITQNQLHRHPGLNEGEDESTKPYRILKLKP